MLWTLIVFWEKFLTRSLCKVVSIFVLLLFLITKIRLNNDARIYDILLSKGKYSFKKRKNLLFSASWRNVWRTWDNISTYTDYFRRRGLINPYTKKADILGINQKYLLFIVKQKIATARTSRIGKFIALPTYSKCTTCASLSQACTCRAF